MHKVVQDFHLPWLDLYKLRANMIKVIFIDPRSINVVGERSSPVRRERDEQKAGILGVRMGTVAGHAG